MPQSVINSCMAPPTVRTKARFMPVHRLFSWADRLLQLSPPGGAKFGSIFARLRACMDELPACKNLITRFRADAHGLLQCQKIVKTEGLCHDTLAQCRTRSGFENLTLAAPSEYGVPYHHGYAPRKTTEPLGTNAARGPRWPRSWDRPPPMACFIR